MITKSEKILSLEQEIQALRDKCDEMGLKYIFYLQDKKIYRYYIDAEIDGISIMMSILEPKYRTLINLIGRSN